MNRIEPIHVAPAAEQKAEPGRFAAALRAAAGGIARGLAATVELAAPFVPGGTLLSAAIRGAAAGSTARHAPASAAGGGAPASSGASKRAGTGERDVLEATRVLQQEARTFSLQYIQLQESMQRDSREFATLSNVMKVKHDSAKAAIDNIH